MKKIFIPQAESTLVVKPEHIIVLEGAEGYTYFYIEDKNNEEGFKKVLASYNLAHFERELDGLPFARVCKKNIVGLEHVVEIRHDRTLVLDYNCCTVALSKDYCVDFKMLLAQTVLH